MTLKLRVRAYLQKANAPVPAKQLISVATKAGVKKHDISELLFEWSKSHKYSATDPDVGTWYDSTERETFFQLYPMTLQEKRTRAREIREFDNMK